MLLNHKSMSSAKEQAPDPQQSLFLAEFKITLIPGLLPVDPRQQLRTSSLEPTKSPSLIKMGALFSNLSLSQSQVIANVAFFAFSSFSCNSLANSITVALIVTGNQTNLVCHGSNTGSAAVVAAGGVAPYTYTWSPSGGSDAAAANLTAGIYQVTVTDANSCSKSHSFNISEPDAFCKNNGTCTGLQTCQCATGWSGADCSTRKSHLNN